jgi:glycosyltransferase involved in cell wall biosynthesis
VELIAISGIHLYSSPGRWRTLVEAVKILFFNFYNGVYAYASGDSLAVGGAEQQQWLLARALAAAGWSVTVGLQEIPHLENGTTIKDVQFISLPASQTFLAPYQRLLSLYRFLQSERPDWLYWRCASHLWGPTVSIAKLAGVRTIFATGFDTDVRPRHALVERPYWWPLYAWGLSYTDRIFVQHSGQFSAVPSNLHHKAAIVPNMIHTPSTTKPHRDRQKYIAWVGMLRQPKRPDLLLEIARKAPNLRFVVCGGPSAHRSPNGYGTPIVDALKRLPNVDYRGQVAPEKAHEIIANASLLLCTSEGEGFPNIFLEAWASGTPVVSMKIDPDQVIERLELGTVSGDVEKTIKDLNLLMKSPQLREEISVRAGRYVAEHHSEQVVTNLFQYAIEPREQFALS